MIDNYWSVTIPTLLEQIRSTADGLTSGEAQVRLRAGGLNRIREHRDLSRLRALANQLRNPLLLILVFAASASALTGEWADAAIVLVVVAATIAIGSSREYGAHEAVRALMGRLQARSRVLRDGRPTTIPSDRLVAGDVVLLSAGSLVPADGRLLEATDCFVSEGVLTGESFPVEKHVGECAPTAALRERTNCLFLGTSLRSGTARCLIARTGADTEFGDIASRLQLKSPETEFDRGTRQFGYLLTSAMLFLVLLVYVAHTLKGRPPIETLLFAVALAVGLSPELLPVILSTSLARGARLMARHGVVVRHLNSIENLGSMDILCTDKTGTLTEGTVTLMGAYDAELRPSNRVRDLARLNAALQTGVENPLDSALLNGTPPDLAGITKLRDVPFDFVRKRVSVIVAGAEHSAAPLLITKGAFPSMLEACDRLPDGRSVDADVIARVTRQYEAWGHEGIRVLAVATRPIPPGSDGGRELEEGLTLEGFLTFLDPPKPDAGDAIRALGRLGVSVKIISGDSRAVAEHVAHLVGLSAGRVLTGGDLAEMTDEALWREAERTDLFAEVEPNQKLRIILALKKMGHVVGFLGDGVNDAPAMHAADTSLAVESAVDVAREAADFVLLDRDLDVIRRGIEEGRTTFHNTLKYVLTTMSANLGNMISMAGASLVLPFLPLTAGQILLNNFVSDIPAFGIATDAVDPELLERPRRWDVGFIGRFMVQFGLLSSAFDFLTFGVLLVGFHVSPALFRTSWFVESLITELVVALVVRTRRPFFRSRPGRLLLWMTIVLIVLSFLTPYLPGAGIFGFVPLPPAMLATIALIAALYVIAVEILKRQFFMATV